MHFSPPLKGTSSAPLQIVYDNIPYTCTHYAPALCYHICFDILALFGSISVTAQGERHGQVVMASDSQSGWSLSARVRIPGREDHSCGQMQTSQQVWRPVVTPATRGGQVMTNNDSG